MQKSDLLVKWKRFVDPISRGWNAYGVAFGMTMTNGWGPAVPQGGYMLYRKIQGGQFDYANPVGFAAPTGDINQVEITTFPWVTHDDGQQYEYRAVAVGAGGVISNTSNGHSFIMESSAIGNLKPNPVSNVSVTALADGQFRVDWSYNADYEAINPVDFVVYDKTNSETIGTVEYVEGINGYSFTTSTAYADEATVEFQVRPRAVSNATVEIGPVTFGKAKSTVPIDPPSGRVVSQPGGGSGGGISSGDVPVLNEA